MTKTTTPGSGSGQSVIHDSDGKNAPLAPSAGQPVTAVTRSGKTVSASGQVSKTSVVFNNPNLG